MEVATSLSRESPWHDACSRRLHMPRRKTLFVVVASALFLFPACATKQQGGAVAGAGVGAVAGHAVGGDVGALVGAVVGAAVGSEIGRQLDEADRRRAAIILEQNATDETGAWVNPDTGYEYRVTPTETYEREGQPCREFRMDSRIGADWEEVYGTACRQPDGSWVMVS
jgi:surface antigen